MEALSEHPAGRGLTPNQLARFLRVSPDLVRAWIRSGEMPAVNVARSRCSKPRFRVLPEHLAEWERSRRVVPPPKEAKRRRQPAPVDYFPND